MHFQEELRPGAFRSFTRVLFAALLCLAFGGVAFAGDTADRGEILVVSARGEVHVTMRGEARSVQAGTVLELPATLRTGKDGALELRQGRTTVGIGANSQIELPLAATLGEAIDRIVQPRGNVFYDVGKRGTRRLRVETPYLVAVIKGTQFNVAVQDDSTTISLFEGRLEVRATDGSDIVDLQAGEIAIRHRSDRAIRVLRMDTGEPVARTTKEIDRVGVVPVKEGDSDNGSRPTPDDSGTSGGGPTRTPPPATVAEVVAPGANVSVSLDPSEGVLPGAVAAQVGVSNDVLDVAAEVGLQAGGKNNEAGANVGLDAGLPPLDTSVAVDAGLSLGGGAVDVDAGASVDAGPVSADVGLGTTIDLGAGAIDAGLDAGVAVGGLTADAGVDAGVDLGAGTVDVGVDAGLGLGGATADVGVDAGVDLGAGTIDAGVDAGLDLGGVTADAGVDAGVDLGAGTIDAGVDAGLDLGGVTADAGVDAGVDVGGGALDVGVDTSVDTGIVDVGVGADVGASPSGGVDVGAGLDLGVVDVGLDVGLGGTDTSGSDGGGLLGLDVGLDLGLGDTSPPVDEGTTTPQPTAPTGGGLLGGLLGGLTGRP